MVVDFLERKLVWLDSLPCVERYYSIRHAILKLAIFLEEIMLHESFAEFRPNSADKLVTSFCIVQPRCLPQQRPGS
ncbi:hypothetical protein P8452_09540 [Trifolium repens]|nr:hypothetical protein P8452_09540 [Trifolium repens]